MCAAADVGSLHALPSEAGAATAATGLQAAGQAVEASTSHSRAPAGTCSELSPTRSTSCRQAEGHVEVSVGPLDSAAGRKAAPAWGARQGEAEWSVQGQELADGHPCPQAPAGLRSALADAMGLMAPQWGKMQAQEGSAAVHVGTGSTACRYGAQGERGGWPEVDTNACMLAPCGPGLTEPQADAVPKERHLWRSGSSKEGHGRPAASDAPQGAAHASGTSAVAPGQASSGSLWYNLVLGRDVELLCTAGHGGAAPGSPDTTADQSAQVQRDACHAGMLNPLSPAKALPQAQDAREEASTPSMGQSGAGGAGMLAVLGQGYMAQVVRGMFNGTPVAVKMLHAHVVSELRRLQASRAPDGQPAGPRVQGTAYAQVLQDLAGQYLVS